MNTQIRKATPTDAAAACRVLRRSITECCVEDHRNVPEALSLWLQNKTPENVAVWFAARENFPVVALVDEQIVGVGLLIATGEVALCYVLPEVRFSGVGNALLRAMESHALQSGVAEIHLSSTATARAFYLRHGYLQRAAPAVECGIRAFPLTKLLCANDDSCGLR
jgi:predicted N-acetyltransferase YhbS